MAQTYQVVVTSQAEKSLGVIVSYLMETASYEVAERVRAGIIEEIRGLSAMPQRHGLLQGVDDLLITYRRVLKWSYRIIFTVEEETFLVLVVDIDHGKRNPEELKNVLL
ncbi:MAG: type II toxin-antitoxin system RelE/ParE family toxin [Phaeodactylibacter sp.]|nr:type II toxin-antitoxin system RelE/ParE family toxin [Phaeodactylibacter sp.]MCB9290882.1 type II toxin-antitoxin system RelE/ParE family toxin [Lewinellaceae bacterium]